MESVPAVHITSLINTIQTGKETRCKKDTVYERDTVTRSESELRGCVKVEVAVLGSLPVSRLIVRMVSADVKQH